MTDVKPQPWNQANATDAIREMGRSTSLDLSYTGHFRERLAERDLLIADARYVLKNGFVFDEPEPSTQSGLFKYRIETRTPNSNNRNVRLVVIPDPQHCWIKIITVMWADE